MSKLNDFNPQVRKFKLLFLNGANLVEMDSAGRVLIPKPLVEYAKLEKELVFTALGNKVEIWSKEQYEIYLQDNVDDFSGLAEEVAGKDFFNPFED